jgi:EAL and modified HD-GYP domain-containing signal transduction protein
MAGWLTRWLGGPRAAPPAASPSIPPPATRQAAGAAAPETEPAASFGLRKPLVGRTGQVAAFELLLPTVAGRHPGAGAEPVAQAAKLTALLWAAKFIGAGGRPALVQVPAPLLARPSVDAAAPAGAMLWVPGLSGLAAELAHGLRQRGVSLGVSDGPPTREPAIDFLVLQAPAGEVDNAILSAQRWLEVWPKLTVVALGLQHLEDVERVLKGGIHLAGGQLGRCAGPTPPRELGSAAHRICELLNHLALDRDTALIAQAVRLDVALSYRLLRYVNSPAIGMARAIETVDQAVTVLGRAELYRWLSVQLLACGAVRQASRAMQESALARGKLLEAVAHARGEADAGGFFTLGLLSLIEPLLQMPLAAAIDPLRLGDTARDALLRRSGPWADRLALLDAIDGADGARIDELAERLGVAEALPALLDAAWQWAAAATETAGEPTVNRAGW